MAETVISDLAMRQTPQPNLSLFSSSHGGRQPWLGRYVRCDLERAGTNGVIAFPHCNTAIRIFWIMAGWANVLFVAVGLYAAIAGLLSLRLPQA